MAMGKLQKTCGFLVLLAAFFVGIPAGAVTVGAVREPPLPTDFQLYQKEGQKSPSWDNLVQAAFETESPETQATSFVFLKKAYDLGCRDALVLSKLALYYEVKQNLKDALKLFVLASEKFEQQYMTHPIRAEADAHAARIAYQLQDFPLSQKFADQALILKPNDFGLLFMSGQLLRKAGKLPEARSRLEQAMQVPAPQGLAFDPQVVVLRELVMTTAQMQDDDACFTYAEMLLKKIPNDQVAMQNRERVLIKRQKIQNENNLKNIILGK